MSLKIHIQDSNLIYCSKESRNYVVMMNHIWVFMLLIGFAYGTLTGHLSEISNSVLDAANNAVGLGVTLLGVVSFWCGIMEIAQESGLVEWMSRKMWPLIHFLFPNIPEGHASLKAICTNFVANILGLGWAATPAGLEAMEELKKWRDEQYQQKSKQELSNLGKNINAKGRINAKASDEMCTFLLINISSLQLIPVNVIAYRSQYGSANPTAIVGPAIIATTVSTAAAILFCKIMSKS